MQIIRGLSRIYAKREEQKRVLTQNREYAETTGVDEITGSEKNIYKEARKTGGKKPKAIKKTAADNTFQYG